MIFLRLSRPPGVSISTRAKEGSSDEALARTFGVWMRIENPEARWRRLLELLSPVHDQGIVTARRLCRSAADGDDLFQAALVRAFEKLHTLREPEKFRAWFYAVLLSVHRTRSRRAFWRRFLPLDDLRGAEPAGDDGNLREDERAATARVRRALAKLPAVQREAVVLFEIEGFSIEEIAALQEVSISAVKSRLARGRRRLRRHWERAHGRPTIDRARAEHRLLAEGDTR